MITFYKAISHAQYHWRNSKIILLTTMYQLKTSIIRLQMTHMPQTPTLSLWKCQSDILSFVALSRVCLKRQHLAFTRKLLEWHKNIMKRVTNDSNASTINTSPRRIVGVAYKNICNCQLVLLHHRACIETNSIFLHHRAPERVQCFFTP